MSFHVNNWKDIQLKIIIKNDEQQIINRWLLSYPARCALSCLRYIDPEFVMKSSNDWMLRTRNIPRNEYAIESMLVRSLLSNWKKNIMNVMNITPKSYFGTCDFPKMLRMILNTRQSFSTGTALCAVLGLKRWDFFRLSSWVCNSPQRNAVCVQNGLSNMNVV